MAVYLDEDHIGSDANELVFPNLLLCMGLGCQMSDGSLIGCHISGASTEDAVLAEVKAKIAAHVGTPKWLYMCADFKEHFLERKLTFTAKARTIGFTGDIFVLDTRPLVGAGGAHVRFKSTGSVSPCHVFVLAEADARPYPSGNLANLPQGSSLLKYSSFKGIASAPGSIKTGDAAPRPGTAVPHNDLKIVRCL